MRIEHWDVAENQGKTAARSMLGREAAARHVPYFFSDLADWTWMEYVGPAYEWNEEIVRGSVDDGKFTVYYLDGDRLAARAGGRPLRRPRAGARADREPRARGPGGFGRRPRLATCSSAGP